MLAILRHMRRNIRTLETEKKEERDFRWRADPHAGLQLIGKQNRYNLVIGRSDGGPARRFVTQ